MIERAFEYLFLLAFFAPPAAVVAGALLLLLPSRRSHSVRHVPRTVGA